MYKKPDCQHVVFGDNSPSYAGPFYESVMSLPKLPGEGGLMYKRRDRHVLYCPTKSGDPSGTAQIVLLLWSALIKTALDPK
jgi:hypothetical protein